LEHGSSVGFFVARLRAGLLLAAVVWLAACSWTQPPSNQTGGNVAIAVGESQPYRLFTHCGVLTAAINDTTFYADPELSDGNANPPPGWGNPFDDGVMTLTTATTADFSDHQGNHAHFTSKLSRPTPSPLVCD
jgi:hypothetical protein